MPLFNLLLRTKLQSHHHTPPLNFQLQSLNTFHTPLSSQYQMGPTTDPHDFPADGSSRRVQVPHQPWAPPAPAIGQSEGHREDIAPPNRRIAGPSRAQDPHHLDMGYQGTIDYRPQPITNPTYVFPDVGHVQGYGIPVQGQPAAPVNQELSGFFPQNVGPGLPQATFPQPFYHQPRAENLRRLANQYLDHPGAQIRMVSAEEDTAGGFKVIIVLETPTVP